MRVLAAKEILNFELSQAASLRQRGGINKNIEAKSKLLLNPLFPTLKKGIIHLFIVSLPKVPEF